MTNLKLHLGCGDKHIEGYTNIDIRYLPGVDEINNIKFLRKYQHNSIDKIYACHVLEHFSRWEYKAVIKRWYDILKPGGTIRIAVPDFEKIVEYYQQTKDLAALRGLICGGQDYDENFHYCCWDFNLLKQDLEECGFEYIHKYDWRNTDHNNIDDYSQSYLPHMDKENGKLMSLNIQATKN
jgi:ubiquinone/menaquinone biosynthesis C-methylase UbiE